MKLLILLAVGLTAGCATVHSGEYGVPLDVPGGYHGPTTAGGLLISSREITSVATQRVGAVEVTFENRSSCWIQISRMALDFQNEAANQLVTTPADADARSWAEAVAQRDAIAMVNRKNALAGALIAGDVLAHAGGHRSTAGTVGAVIALGALIGLAAAAADEETESAQRVSFLPQDHLLVVPFAIPPGLFVKRWIALTTESPQIPCLDRFILRYDTTAGRHERVYLRFRGPEISSGWQPWACRRR
jgi:hypothetical protein